ncbi:MAG: helix-turn-helix domain-containing protein, partial [Nocardioides sp.]|nr:helix-turn-helix domain-containing protein [Nocardioides sp.]
SGADTLGLLRSRAGAPAHLPGTQTNTPTLSGLKPLLSIEELSEYFNVPVRTLYDWRLAGKGPCAVHVGRQLRYSVSDVHDWLRNQRELEPGRSPDGR